MLEWLAANAATIIISAVLFVLMALAIRYLWKTSRRGGCVGCSECSKGCGGSVSYTHLEGASVI